MVFLQPEAFARNRVFHIAFPARCSQGKAARSDGLGSSTSDARFEKIRQRARFFCSAWGSNQPDMGLVFGIICRAAVPWETRWSFLPSQRDSAAGRMPCFPQILPRGAAMNQPRGKLRRMPGLPHLPCGKATSQIDQLNTYSWCERWSSSVYRFERGKCRTGFLLAEVAVLPQGKKYQTLAEAQKLCSKLAQLKIRNCKNQKTQKKKRVEVESNRIKRCGQRQKLQTFARSGSLNPSRASTALNCAAAQSRAAVTTQHPCVIQVVCIRREWTSHMRAEL